MEQKPGARAPVTFYGSADVFQLSAFLPLLGLIAAFLPRLDSGTPALKPDRA
jgi:hypothetical protein